MRCPYCNSTNNYVYGRGQAATDKDTSFKRRRRKCRDCGMKFWTMEEYSKAVRAYVERR